MISRIILGVLLIACFCIGAQPPTPQPPPVPSKPTTDDERNNANLHAKLRAYKGNPHSLTAAVKALPSHHLITYMEVDRAASPNPPKTGQEYIQAITCKSDLVVLGNVTKQISSLSEDGGAVFSDYYFNVTQTLYSKQNLNQQRVVVVLRGGRVETPDGIIEVRFKNLHGIPVGGPPFHLLFLKRITQEGMPSDSFFLSDLYGAFFLYPDHPINFSATATEDAGLTRLVGKMSRTQMIEAVRTSAGACGGAN